ncbi:MAG: hypothetical protein UX78_C0006G0011 [Candidatus Amesbacteria bacterium GW2011_GWA2_47_11]|uniref:Uncharacterized protein n=3 Tax=Candidatus Amesiibacteriota TaxID=1752730 RepID=A0A0G1ULH0_9BACT|nr:MAG: hypothetical protein UX78_C0006G0011 [Candidatus Amesbacteria bacterium GW2011_GWA2_47_11]KKU95032.1 MAG: hypothetical protein UY22_C0002G0010 [Candidatus Amesbacteria bacterium GW2011_GWC1_48_10]KKW00696.1 MAG: hypothetical protein UY33_C0007G0009 [Candidatus Amesbacteria bacterium GW2011_GWA1_48_9]
MGSPNESIRHQIRRWELARNTTPYLTALYLATTFVDVFGRHSETMLNAFIPSTIVIALIYFVSNYQVKRLNRKLKETTSPGSEEST